MKRLPVNLVWIALSLLAAVALTLLLAAAPARAGHAANAAGTPVCAPITADTTWTAAGSPYQVCGGYALAVSQGATLTLQPGVAVQFAPGAQLVVNGTLIASGLPTQPITLTGTSVVPGAWRGISFYGSVAQANRSRLDYVTVDGAGAGAGTGALYLDSTDLKIRHTLIRNGAANGIYGAGAGSADIADTRFENNAGYAVWFVDGSVNPVLARLAASGNLADAVALSGFAYLHGDHVWEYTGLPYIWKGGVQVTAGSTLTVEPGVEARFEANQGLQVFGRLAARGLPSQPITFTGTTRTPGAWAGLQILGTAGNPGVAEMDYVTVEYGGVAPSGANLYLDFGQAAVRHATIRNGGNDGVRIATGAAGSSIFAGQITGNAGYAVRNYTPGRPLLATNNWWGSASGPNSDAGCGSGSGGRASTGVIFRPVLSSPGNAPPVLALSQATQVTLSPQRWFAPADGTTRAYFDITVRDGNGTPLAGRTVQLNSTLGTPVSGGITDAAGHTLAYLTSSSPGDAQVNAALAAVTCEDATSPVSQITFTAPAAGTDLLPNAAAPYLDADLDLSPLPILRGVPAVISGKLTNPLAVPVTVDASLDYAQSSIGLAFGPIGQFSGRVIPANGSLTVSQTWVPAAEGHYCVQLRYTITAVAGRPAAETANAAGSGFKQKNVDVQGGGLKSPDQQQMMDKTRRSLQTTNQFVNRAYDTGPIAIPLALANALIDWDLNRAGQIFRSLTGDPPSQDYRHIATPLRIPLPPVQPDPQHNLSAARAAALNAFADALATMNAYGEAAAAANDRYGGAVQALDLQWSSLQTAALLDYRTAMASAAITASLRLGDLINVAQSEGVSQVVITPDEVSAFQQKLATSGFSAQQVADAHAVGLSDAGIEAIRQDILSADPMAGAGDFVAEMQIVRDDLARLGNVLLQPAVFAPTLVVGGGAGLAQPAEVTASGNSLAQAFDSSTTLVLGNPLGQSATIDISPRRVDLPADWMVSISPRQVTLAPGATAEVTVNVIAGSPVAQGSVQRVAVEGYAGGQLLGGVAVDVVAPSYVFFDGRLRTYLPLLRR